MISLPIDLHIDSILEKFNAKKNLILKASPGSGKTTRLPAALLKLFQAKSITDKKIIVLVPKRIAAVSAADRIADENNWTLGDQVGFHVRFEPVFNEHTQLIFMTEGLFIKKTVDSNFWSSIGVLIFDEFHERSSLMDMALGLAIEKQILSNESLKLVVMSATLNSAALENFLPEHATVDIKAPPYALKINYSTKPQRLVCDADFYSALAQVCFAAWNEGRKDILIFLPGLGEIRKAELAIQKKLPSVPIAILHSSIKLSDQKEILKPNPTRRIILSTDIAESSLTLPNVDSVIDSGLRKVAVPEFKIGFSQLDLQRISLFSATQRSGRAARTGPGTVYRLWHESDERSMPEQIKPEILSSDLTEEILTLKSCDVNDIKNFSWLDQPNEKSIQLALLKLKQWQVINQHEQITTLGRQIQNLPLNLENSLLFQKLAEAGFQSEASYLIACLETSDFSKLFADRLHTGENDLERLFTTGSALNPLGIKLKTQLDGIRIKNTNQNREADFRKKLIEIFFDLFPNRIAKRKHLTEGLSSLGRGVTLRAGLQANDCDYYLLLAGFNGPNNKTDISFAVGFSKDELLKFSVDSVRVQRNYQLDLVKKMIYKTDVQRIGQFIISETAKTPLSAKEIAGVWPELSVLNSEVLLQSHPEYLPYIDKVNFLKKKKDVLNYDDSLFEFIKNLSSDVMTDLASAVSSFDDFFSYPLRELLQVYTPEPLRTDVKKLPDFLNLPSGKKASLDYLSENSPLISVKIQDIFGWNLTPTVLDQRLTVTLELLAPNMRPTQVTQNLKRFWLVSYFDIRKELKARYPKHLWPDNPADFKFEKKK